MTVSSKIVNNRNRKSNPNPKWNQTWFCLKFPGYICELVIYEVSKVISSNVKWSRSVGNEWLRAQNQEIVLKIKKIYLKNLKLYLNIKKHMLTKKYKYIFKNI